MINTDPTPHAGESPGLTPGIELSVVLVDGRIEIEVPTRSMQLERREGALVAVADEPMPTLTSEQVRDTLEQVRR